LEEIQTNITNTREDTLNEIRNIFSEIDSLKEIVIEGNNEIKKLILEYSIEISKINSKLSRIEKIIVSE
jgi:hypothetical protein